MKKLNVGFILRKAAMASTPVMTITEVKDSFVSKRLGMYPTYSLTRERMAQKSFLDRRGATGQ